MGLFVPSPALPLYRFARQVARFAARWHHASCEGLEHIPAGPVLLVGNHGLFGFETPVFFSLLLDATGRVPVGLTDRVFFGAPPMRQLLAQVGGVLGTRENALALLERGHLVVCYPGGSREVFKPPVRKYQLRWEQSDGFAQVAYRARVPVVPFAAIGVDDSYVNLGHLPGSTRVLGRYAIPVGFGLGPVPLPMPFRFRVGLPLAPPSSAEHVQSFKEAVQRRVEAMLALIRPPGEDFDGEADPASKPALH